MLFGEWVDAGKRKNKNYVMEPGICSICLILLIESMTAKLNRIEKKNSERGSGLRYWYNEFEISWDFQGEMSISQ